MARYRAYVYMYVYVYVVTYIYAQCLHVKHGEAGVSARRKRREERGFRAQPFLRQFSGGSRGSPTRASSSSKAFAPCAPPLRKEIRLADFLFACERARARACSCLDARDELCDEYILLTRARGESIEIFLRCSCAVFSDFALAASGNLPSAFATLSTNSLYASALLAVSKN